MSDVVTGLAVDDVAAEPADQKVVAETAEDSVGTTTTVKAVRCGTSRMVSSIRVPRR